MAAVPDTITHQAENASMIGHIAIRVRYDMRYSDTLQVRRLLNGRLHLHHTEIGIAYHTDIAVAPGLLSDPFYKVVAVLSFWTRELALRRSGTSYIPDYVNISSGDIVVEITSFDIPIPNGASIQRL